MAFSRSVVCMGRVCFSLFSVAVVNTRTKSNLGEERLYLAYCL